MIAVVAGAVVLGFVVILLVSALSGPVPRQGHDAIEGVAVPPEAFFSQVESMLRDLGLTVRVAGGDAPASVLFEAVDATPVRGVRLLVLARHDPPGAAVGLQDVVRLADSLRGHDAHKGVLVTTGGFLPEAHTAEAPWRVELVDGARWAALAEAEPGGRGAVSELPRALLERHGAGEEEPEVEVGREPEA